MLIQARRRQYVRIILAATVCMNKYANRISPCEIFHGEAASDIHIRAFNLTN